MTFEASLVGKKNKETITQANRVIRKKKCRMRRKHHLPKVPISLQKLFLACKDVFKGPGTVPPPHDVEKLEHILDFLHSGSWLDLYNLLPMNVWRSALPQEIYTSKRRARTCFSSVSDNMKPEDVGLSSELLFFKPRSVIKGTPSVTCTTIYQCKNFSLCLFFLPPTAVIPLHNHPEMTVFSKLLLGSMHIKSFDWVDSNTCDDSTPMRLARMKVNNVFTAPCNTSVLYPTSGGNIHAFTAVTACAVLDVIGPPYSKDDGRDCSYYRESPYSNSLNGATTKAEGNDDDDDDASYGWLEEIQVPKDLRMDRIEYLGPQIVETSC